MDTVSNTKPLAIVVMGVSASGKSTIGKGIADKIGIPFEDGDSYHPDSNIEKMKAGTFSRFFPAHVLILQLS